MEDLTPYTFDDTTHLSQNYIKKAELARMKDSFK